MKMNIQEPRQKIPRQRSSFSAAGGRFEHGYYYENGEIIRTVNGEKRHICFENELKILGIHNMENIMAAVAIAECFHVPSEVIYDTLIHFKAVAHRIEYVATKKVLIIITTLRGQIRMQP